MPKFVTALTLFVSLSAFAQNQAPSEVQKLTGGFNTTMMKCPEKIWSNYKWDGLKVVLMYPSKSESWVWVASANTIQTITNAELPGSAVGSSYEFFDLNGHKAMSLNMEEGMTEIFELGVHEFFHHIGQESWTRFQTGGRGTLYPLNGEPRFYRRMIYDNLKQYLQAGNQDSLGRAKYWFDKWTNEFSNETQSTTDGYEGTAKYVATMAAAVAKLGCSATDEQIKASVINEVTSDFGFSVSGQYLALDSEGYDIGGLAALILRFNGTELSEWNRRMAAGETPLQVLFESVTPVVEATQGGLRNTFIQAAQKLNNEMRPILDADIANWKNKEYVRVPAPYEWLQSNLRPKFFARSSELEMELFPLATAHHYVSNTPKASDFHLKADAVVFDYYTSTCPNQYLFTLVPMTVINLNNRIADVSSETFAGRLVGEVKTDEQGFKFFCVE